MMSADAKMTTRNAFLAWAEQLSRDECLVFLLFALLPVIVLVANPDVYGNRIGDIDTWFYYGHFTSLGQYRHVDASIGNNYYQTRLPYLIPGYIIFSVFSEAWAKFILAYASYAATVASFYYLVVANFGRRQAVLVTALFATDVFFVRAYGWNYVDIGVIAYFTMGMAGLTWAARGETGRFGKLVLAGFAFACMLFIHLGSAILAVPALAYVWYVMPEARTRLGMTYVIIGVVVGAVAAQVVFGVLNKAIWGSRFFFLIEQIAVGRIELKTNPSWESPFALLRNGPWVTVHFAIWLASAVALGFANFGRVQFDRRDVVWLLSVIILYAVLFAVDAAGFSNFTMREGLRMTFFLTTSYFCLPFLIGVMPSRWMAGLIVLITIAALAANLRLHIDEHLSNGLIVALVIALALTVGFYLRRTAVTAMALLAVIAARFFVVWPFAQNETIYQAHALIRSLAGNDLPRFITSDKDPLYGMILSCIVSTFTERAWWLHGTKFPDLPNLAMWQNNKVFVLSSIITDINDVERQLATKVDRIVPLGYFSLGPPGQVVHVFEFEASNRIGFPAAFAQFQAQRAAIPAAMLPSTLGSGTVSGDGRLANGKSGAGYLNFGPYAMLAAGKYQVVFTYGPVIGRQGWDVVGLDQATGRKRMLAEGVFPETEKAGQLMTVDIDLPGSVMNFETRTQFFGKGTLGVAAIGIVPLN